MGNLKIGDTVQFIRDVRLSSADGNKWFDMKDQYATVFSEVFTDISDEKLCLVRFDNVTFVTVVLLKDIVLVKELEEEEKKEEIKEEEEVKDNLGASYLGSIYNINDVYVASMTVEDAIATYKRMSEETPVRKLNMIDNNAYISRYTE